MKLCRAGDRALQLLLFNEESLVSASHQLALITSLPFVHTARRYYRLNGSVRRPDWPQGGRQRPPRAGKFSKLDHLEEVKVVTRSPLVNQRRDHCWNAPQGAPRQPFVNLYLHSLPRRQAASPLGEGALLLWSSNTWEKDSRPAGGPVKLLYLH